MVLMVSALDHITGAAGLTLTIRLSKNGGAFLLITPTVADLGFGWYNIQLTTADTDTLGDLVLHITALFADPTDVTDTVTNLSGEVWDVALLSHTAVGTTGKTLSDITTNVDVAVSTRLDATSYVVPPTTSAISSAVWEEPVLSHTAAGTTGLTLNQIKADTATIIVSEASLTSIMNLVLQYEKGRTKIDVPSATLTVYGTDGITPIQVFNLLDSAGNPSVLEVAERAPTI